MPGKAMHRFQSLRHERGRTECAQRRPAGKNIRVLPKRKAFG